MIHDLFPTLLGYAKVYDSSKLTGRPLEEPKSIRKELRPAYQMHLKRNPKPKLHQDCVYYTLLSRLYQEKILRRDPASVNKDDSKHGEPSQVCLIKIIKD